MNGFIGITRASMPGTDVRATNVLVVGFGNMGRNHARVLSDLGHTVRTLDPRIGSGADQSMVTAGLVNVTDTVVVATPIDHLAEQADAWLRRGKDVLVEKPGATDVATLAYLHQLAREQGRKFCVGYTERHNGSVATLADSLDLVGTVRHINARRLGYADSTIDPALNLAVHDLDVLDALGYAMQVEGSVRRDGHLGVFLSAARSIDDDDLATVSIEASHLHPFKVRELEAIGTDGVLQLDYQRRKLTVTDRDGDLRWLRSQGGEPLRREWESFFADEPMSDGIAALAAVESLPGLRAGDALRGGLGWSSAVPCTAQ